MRSLVWERIVRAGLSVRLLGVVNVDQNTLLLGFDCLVLDPLLLNAEVSGECRVSIEHASHVVSDLGIDCFRESVCPNPWNEP